MDQGEKRPRIDWLSMLPFLVAVAGVLAYANSFHAPFLLDDHKLIVSNPDIRHLFPFLFRSRIVGELSFKLNYAVSGLQYADYHVVNLAIHITAGFLLYGILRRTFLLPSLRQRFGTHSRWLALVASLIWVVHPLQTASVTYIIQRFECMAGLFMFLTLYGYIRAITSSGTAEKRVWYACSWLSCIMGMGTKEIMIVAPVLVVFYGYFYVCSSLRQLWDRHGKIYTAYLAVSLIYLGLLFLDIRSGSFHGPNSINAISSLQYLVTQFGVIVHYLRLSFVPYPLCFDYGWLPAETIQDWILPGIFIGILGLSVLFGIIKRKAWGFPGLWFFVILAPTSSFIALDDVAFEHRMYLPLAGVMVLTVAAVYSIASQLIERNKRLFCLVSICGVLLSSTAVVFLACLTHRRNIVYQSSEAVWRDVVEKKPDNYRAIIALTSGLLNKGYNEEAETRLKQLVARINTVKKSGTSKALKKRAMRFEPEANNQLGRILLYGNRVDDAVRCFRIASQGRPRYKVAYHNLGVALIAAERLEEALVACDAALDIDPGYADAYALKAYILVEHKRYEEAVTLYKKAVDLFPRLFRVKMDLAWILATCPQDDVRDGDVAVKLASEVCRATNWRSAGALDVLAASYAEKGEYTNAVRCVDKALNVLFEEGQDTINSSDSISAKRKRFSHNKQDLYERHEYYIQNKPFRDNPRAVEEKL